MLMHSSHMIAHFFVGCHIHDHWFVPGPPLPKLPILPHIAASTMLGFTIKAVYSTNVLGPLGIPMVGQGNDSGLIVAHLGIPPNNGLVPLHIAFGSSKPPFSASTVQIDCQGSRKPTSASHIPFLPISVNQSCSDPLNLPLDLVICPTNVFVGLTLGDFIAGYAAIILDSAISFGVNKLAGKLSDRISGAISSRITRETTEALAQRVGSEAGERFVREASDEAISAAAKSIGLFVGESVSNVAKELSSLVTDPAAEAVSEGVAGGLADRASTDDPPMPEGSTPVHRAD